MIKAEKKFHGGRRYYHSAVETVDDTMANPSWPERQRKMRNAQRLRLWRILGMGLFMIGVVAGTFFLMTR